MAGGGSGVECIFNRFFFFLFLGWGRGRRRREQGSLCLILNPQESHAPFMADALADTRNPSTLPVLVRGVARARWGRGGGCRLPHYTLGLKPRGLWLQRRSRAPPQPSA